MQPYLKMKKAASGSITGHETAVLDREEGLKKLGLHFSCSFEAGCSLKINMPHNIGRLSNSSSCSCTSVEFRTCAPKEKNSSLLPPKTMTKELLQLV